MSTSSGTSLIPLAEAKKLRKKPTHQTLFNQTPTRKKQLMVPVKLNKQKQTTRLQKALNSFSDLDLANLKYSTQRKSATLGNIHPFVFKALSNVFNTFCGPESQIAPKCITHTSVPFLFSAQDNWDKSEPPALLAQIFNVKQSMGNSITKVGYLTLHYSKRKLQISSHLAENVPVLVEYLVDPLVEITNRCGAVNISEAKCMDCTLNLNTLQTSKDKLTPVKTVNENSPIIVPPCTGVSHETSPPRSRPLLCITEGDVTPQPELIINPLIQSFPLNKLPPLPYYVTTTQPRKFKERTQPVPESPTHLPTEIPSRPNKVNTPLFELPPMSKTPTRPQRVLSPTIAQNRAILEFNRLCDRLNSVESQALENTSRLHGLECQSKVPNASEAEVEIASLKKELVHLKKLHAEEASRLNKKLDAAHKTITDLTKEISEIKGMLRTPPPTCCSKADTRDIITSVIDHMVDKFKEITVQPSPPSQNADVAPSDNSSTQSTQHDSVTQPTTSQRRDRTPSVQHNRSPSPAQQIRPPQRTGRQATRESQRQRTVRAPDSPPPYTQTSVKIIGGSNCGKISNALRNTIPNIVVQATSGSTFDSVLGDIRRSERCDVMVIQGGVNEADTLVNMEDARSPLKLAILAAKAKASKVIVMPPPPLSHPRLQSKAQRMSNIMRYEAQQARCEYVDVQSKYNDDRICGQYIIASDGKHVTKLGGGIYAYSLVDHLYNNHRQLNVNLNFCVNCQHTGHRFDNCHIGRSATRQHQHSSHEFTPATHTASPYTSQLRSPPNFTHSNRFQVLDDYNSRYLNNLRDSSSRQRR